MSLSPCLERSIILTLVLASIWLLAETDTGFGYPMTLSPEAVVTKRLPDTMYTVSNSPGSQEIGIALKRSHGGNHSLSCSNILR